MTGQGVTRAFSGGTGTKDDPYQVTTAIQIWNIADHIRLNRTNWSGVYFKLMNDISFVGKEFLPIGGHVEANSDPSLAKYFAGNFDGNFKTISGIFHDASDMDLVGLFGKIQGTIDKPCVIKNIHIKSMELVGYSYTAAVAGYVGAYANVEDCHLAGGTNEATIITGFNAVGGLVGYSEGMVLSSSSYEISISGIGDFIGGLIGHNKGLVSKSFYYSAQSDKGISVYPYAPNKFDIGYLVGLSEGEAAVVVDSYVFVNKTSGFGSFPRIRNGAGLIGRILNHGQSSIRNCYVVNNTILPNSANFIDPFIGKQEASQGAITNCYYESITESSVAEIIKKTQLEMESDAMIPLLNGKTTGIPDPWLKALSRDPYTRPVLAWQNRIENTIIGDLNIYEGDIINTVSSIQVGGRTIYRMPVVSNKWYAISLPFDVEAVKVSSTKDLDVEGPNVYLLKNYWNADMGWNFLLRHLPVGSYKSPVELEQAWRDQPALMSSTNPAVKGNYIVRFVSSSNYYDGKWIYFVGKAGQTIDGANTPIIEHVIIKNPETKDEYGGYMNPTLANKAIGKAYKLVGNNLDLIQNTYIRPFESYVLASEVVMARTNRLALFSEVTTGNVEVFEPGTKSLSFKVLPFDSKQIVVEATENQTLSVYNSAGGKVGEYRLVEGESKLISLESSIYLLQNQLGESLKISVK